MQVLQVKEYHERIARVKEYEALQRWREKNNGYGYPIKSMFYFYCTDRYGYPTTLRQRGYVTFNETSARFSMSK